MERVLAKSTVARAARTDQQLLLFVSGAAGTGKTTLLRELRQVIAETKPDAKIKTVAPTGLSAFIIGGRTIHSVFGIRYVKTGGEYTPRATIYLYVDWLVVDEISMVSREIFAEMERLTRLVADRKREPSSREREPFGGASVIVFGDLLQLQPVEGRKIFECDGSDDVREVAQPVANVRRNLWRSFEYIELRQNYRNGHDAQLSLLLSQLRNPYSPKLTKHSLNLKPLYERRLCSKNMTRELTRFDPTKNCDETVIHLFSTQKAVKQFNDQVLQLQSFADEDSVLTSIAIDTVTHLDEDSEDEDDDDSGREPSIRTKRLRKYKRKGIPQNVCGLPKSITLVVGACVMLTANINVERGLVNGRIGKVTRVKPLVKVQFDDFFCLNGEQNAVIERISATELNLSYMTRIERNQYPLANGPAFTIHRMQGVTLRQPVVIHFSPLFCSSLAYTALSRVQRMDDLAIADKDISIVHSNHPPRDALREIERLRAKELRLPKHIPKNIYC